MPKLHERDVSEKEFYRYVEDTMTGALISEYPKMLYKSAAIPHNEHHHQGEPLLLAGKHEVATMTVASEDEEIAALAEGWSDKIEPQEPRRGPGRPPKQEG